MQRLFWNSPRKSKRGLWTKSLRRIPRKRSASSKILYEEFVKILGEGGKLDLPTNRSNVILVVGIQGSGKTTTIGKLGAFFQRGATGLG